MSLGVKTQLHKSRKEKWHNTPSEGNIAWQKSGFQIKSILTLELNLCNLTVFIYRFYCTSPTCGCGGVFPFTVRSLEQKLSIQNIYVVANTTRPRFFQQIFSVVIKLKCHKTFTTLWILLEPSEVWQHILLTKHACVFLKASFTQGFQKLGFPLCTGMVIKLQTFGFHLFWSNCMLCVLCTAVRIQC